MEKDKEKNYGEPKLISGKWFENFWYHHKEVTIVAIIGIITVLISTAQLLTREKYDFYTLYAGPQILAMQDVVYIQRGISEFATDYNGDGEIKVALNNIVMLSPEERAAAEEKGSVFNNDFVQQSLIEFYQQVIAGDAVIFLLSPYLYDSVHAEDLFMPLSEIFGDSIPESAYDKCGIILSETDFGSSFNGIDDLPANTILCIRQITTLKNTKKNITHQDSYVELFKAIVNYIKD